MATVETTIRDDVKAAMKAGRKDELEVLRMVQADAKNAAIAGGIDRTGIPDDLFLKVLRRGIKTRKESAQVFEQAGRQELADKEAFQIGILERYMPQGASEEEVAVVVDAVIADLGAKEKKDMGPVMKEVLSRLSGRADGKIVSQLVGSRLT